MTQQAPHSDIWRARNKAYTNVLVQAAFECQLAALLSWRLVELSFLRARRVA